MWLSEQRDLRVNATPPLPACDLSSFVRRKHQSPSETKFSNLSYLSVMFVTFCHTKLFLLAGCCKSHIYIWLSIPYLTYPSCSRYCIKSLTISLLSVHVTTPFLSSTENRLEYPHVPLQTG